MILKIIMKKIYILFIISFSSTLGKNAITFPKKTMNSAHPSFLNLQTSSYGLSLTLLGLHVKNINISAFLAA